MANPEFRAASAVVTVPSEGNGSIDVAKPAGTVDGDYILIFCLTGNASAAATVAPAGFGAPLLESVNDTFGGGFRVFGKVASSEPASWTLTETASTAQGQAFALSYSSPGGTPINAAVLGGFQSGTSSQTPAITATLAGKLIGVWVEYANRSITITPPGTMTARLTRATAISAMVADQEITAGALGTRTATSPTGDFITGAIVLAGAGGGGDVTAPDVTSTGTGSTNGPFAANLAENSTAAFITLTASENVTWGALGGADAALFQKLNETATTVQLRAVSGFNFESLPHANPFVVTISATDGSSNARTVTVNATITNVNEPPGAPTIGTATAGNASASVAFTAPAANGGPSPTSYTATSSPGGLTGTGASSPITVSGLTNGTGYTFTVTATNSEGTGPASAASNSVTPAAPGSGPTINTQPQNATAINPAAATFSVAATTSGGALSYQWRRNGTPIGGATSSSYTTPATTRTGGSANNGDVYTCAVTDSNGTTISSGATLSVAYGFPFDTAVGAIVGNISGSLVGLGRDPGGTTITLRAYNPTTGALVTSQALTTASTGRLPRWGDMTLDNAVTYDCVLKWADGDIESFRLAPT